MLAPPVRQPPLALPAKPVKWPLGSLGLLDPGLPGANTKQFRKSRGDIPNVCHGFAWMPVNELNLTRTLCFGCKPPRAKPHLLHLSRSIGSVLRCPGHQTVSVCYAPLAMKGSERRLASVAPQNIGAIVRSLDSTPE